MLDTFKVILSLPSNTYVIKDVVDIANNMLLFYYRI